MIKKWICIVLLVFLIVTVTGCGSSPVDRSGSQNANVKEVLEEGMEKSGDRNSDGKNSSFEESSVGHRQSGVSADAPKPESPDESVQTSRTEGIDVDLTALSSTMVYSEVYNMMTAPENYIGKTIRMNGRFTGFHDESSGNNYFACIIRDATACCAQGMEFVLKEDQYTYPDDYPEEDAQITVVGVFDTYREGDSTYCTLRNADLV